MPKVKGMKNIEIACAGFVMILVIMACAMSVSADSVRIEKGEDLIEQARSMNGQTVIIQGEVIGDIMPRQDHFWINLMINGTAIGVWINEEQRQIIGTTGQYGVRGDLVEVVGRFFQACPEHGGDLDVHAQSIRLVTAGEELLQPLNIKRLIVAAILLAAAVACLYFLYRKLAAQWFKKVM